MEASKPTRQAKPPKKRTIWIIVGFFVLAGLGMIAGGAYAWHDEHSGTAGTAHIYKCYDNISRYGGGLDCYARWTVNDHVVTGYVENAKADQVGKDVSVRIHAHHVTEQTYWVPIGLWVMGILVVGFFVWLALKLGRRPVDADGRIIPAPRATG